METLLFILTLTIITPEGQPNRERRVETPTIEKCWEVAKKFVDEVDPVQLGGIAVMASCAKGKRPAGPPPAERGA
jgi:hypothetical protein